MCSTRQGRGNAARSAIHALYGLGAALACLPAAAQTEIPSANDWRFEFVPYLWTAGIRSDLKLGPLPGSTLSVSSTNVLKALDFGAMGTLEARKGDWGGLLDMQYVKLGVGNQVAGGLLGGYDVSFTQQVYTLSGFYRLVKGPVEVDLLAGARYANVKTRIDIAPSLRGLGGQIEAGTGSWNGIVGVRAIAPLGDKWSVMGYLDAGDGGSSSSWQAIAGASYDYSPTVSFKIGYRYLDYKRDDALINKAAMAGPYFGAGFKF